ncbi:MAG: helix-turn-helix transcriptional regulator [Oscillospiraceae bacterium]|nr:helix-turn-helix transcriptional regulator [Oscillospiraceae bacterium]
MPKIVFTPELAETIKDLRIKNKVPSKNVALAIGRSPSYVSKLESFGIKSISQEEFDHLLEVIITDGSTLDERREHLISLYTVKYSKAEREDQLWFYNLDRIAMQLPIPCSLVEEINDMLNSLCITVEQLVARINQNEELTEEDSKNAKLPVNEWFMSSGDPNSNFSIKLDLSEEYVSAILSNEVEFCSYTVMLAIVHYIIKISMHDSTHTWSEPDLRELEDKTQEVLDRNKFFTVSHKAMLLSSAQTQVEIDNILNEFDVRSRELINKILQHLKFATDINVVRSTARLEQYLNNLNWDPGFTMQLTSLKFDSIGECSYSNKVSMLKEIASVIAKYRDMPEDEKCVETYDFPEL